MTQKGRSDLTAPMRDLVDYLVKATSDGSSGLFPGQHHCPKVQEVSAIVDPSNLIRIRASVSRSL